MTGAATVSADSAWDAATVRSRLARLLLVRSDMTPDGLPTELTRRAALAGIGAFHGPPMLERDSLIGPAAARRFNEELHGLGLGEYGIPALIGGNGEHGLAYTTRVGGTNVPYPAALGLADPGLSETAGRVVGEDFAAAGYSWAFQPVVDVRTATEDPVIGVRAFGSDPALVSAHGAAYIAGMQSAGILATAKHYPGHGDATVDSHLGLPVVHRSASDQETHLAPFRAAVAADVATMMSAHVVLPGFGGDALATFSREICTDLLRDDLGFRGALVTDSLRMAAVADLMGYDDAFIASLHAGCDVMNIRCWPDEIESLLDQLEARFHAGDIDETALRTAFDRVVSMQSRISPSAKATPPEQTRAFADPRLAELVEKTDPEGILPLRVPSNGTLGVLVDSPRGTDAPPLTLLETMENVLGCRTRRVTTDAIDADVDALLVVSFGQAGPTASERDHFTLARESRVPTAALIAGPRGPVGQSGLAEIAIPAIDVFGLGSAATLAVALPVAVTVS